MEEVGSGEYDDGHCPITFLALAFSPGFVFGSGTRHGFGLAEKSPKVLATFATVSLDDIP